MSKEFIYPQCDYQINYETCGEDGCYHCRLCQKNWCWDHLCDHLQGAQQNDIRTIQTMAEVCEIDGLVRAHEDNQLSTIHNNNRQDISTLSESQLQSELRRHFKEAKRIQRELERRMIECSGLDYQYGISRNNNNSRAGPNTNKNKSNRKRQKQLASEDKIKVALQQLLQTGLSQQQILQRIFKK